jgi:hypothetical protein
MDNSHDEKILIQKQEILKFEIIDKQYDKELFLDYCISKKDNGDDLSNWTIEELRAIIKDFQKENNEKELEEIDINGDKKDLEAEVDNLDMEVFRNI